MNHDFLPVCREDMEKRGWKSVDFAYIIGDGYVDHPSFGHAIISRLLESRGYRVGIISQPDWKDPESICIYGEPRLGFLVSAGNMDSMVNHYSVSKKRRRTDAYTPGGEMGKRPDHACVVYGNLIRQKYKKTAVIMGGIEASLRRMAHYDYWSDKLKRSILLDSGADIVSYGMGERKYENLKKGESTQKNIQKQKLKVQRLHHKIDNIRTDYINKSIAEIVKTKPSYITIENLNVSGMMKNRHLSKAVASQKFYEFRTKLKAKCDENGIELRVVDRWYPSSKICHCCGAIEKDLKLSDRIYRCDCGYVEDRDFNAALNLRDALTYEVA